MSYRFELARTPEAFHALAANWQALDAETGCRNPFLSYEWAAACLLHSPENLSPYVLTAWSGARLVGAAPLQLERRKGFRVLSFIGGRWSEYVALHAAPDAADVGDALLAELARRHGVWDLLLLYPIGEPRTDLLRKKPSTHAAQSHARRCRRAVPGLRWRLGNAVQDWSLLAARDAEIAAVRA